jgi:hypothetical protein
MKTSSSLEVGGKRRKLDALQSCELDGGDDLSAASSDQDDDEDDSGPLGTSSNQQLFRIERKIKEGNELSKQERRLL